MSKKINKEDIDKKKCFTKTDMGSLFVDQKLKYYIRFVYANDKHIF